jgi:putative transposase
MNSKEHNYSLKSIILESGISTQSYYQRLANEVIIEDDYAFFVDIIIQKRQVHPGMGLRQIWEITRPSISRDDFMAIGTYAGLCQEAPKNPVRTTFSVKSNRYSNLLIDKRFTDVNQLWVCDITYFYDKNGQLYYLFFMMDAYSRRIIGYSGADNLRASNAIDALKMALKTRNISDYKGGLIHHSDRGSQYIANLYTDQLEVANIQISMCQSALENAFVERVHGTIKNQYLIHRPIDSLKSLMFWLEKDVNTYNNNRPHAALKGMSPVQFEKQLTTIPIPKRTKMSAFIINKEAKSKVDKNQLSLFCTI